MTEHATGVSIKHNHTNRVVKKRGLCPACDEWFSEFQFPAADSEGNYQTEDIKELDTRFEDLLQYVRDFQ